MKKAIKIQPSQEGWWAGQLVMNYNLKTVVKVIAILATITAVIGIIVLLVKGVWAILCFLASIWQWLLGGAILALVIWMLSRVNWDSIDKEKAKKPAKVIGLILLVAAITFLLQSLFKSCTKEDKEVESDAPQAQVENTVNAVTTERFDNTFDLVVTLRAYLDSVQDATSHNGRVLVGLKHVNGQSVNDLVFAGKTYDEAVDIIAKDWRELVVTELDGQTLSDNQLIATVLFAMRNGKYGFEKSDFLKAVKGGRFDEAAKAMALHKADGTKRELGTETQQYLWVLKNLWDGNLSAQELVDMPMWSYLQIHTSNMYDNKGNHLFNNSLCEKLNRGDQPSARVALGLE